MTHRVHPYIFRMNQVTNWKSRWFNAKRYQAYLREDTLLREWLGKRLRAAHLSAIEIERSPTHLSIILKTARPGILIGRGGAGVENLKREMEAKLSQIQRRFKTLKGRAAGFSPEVGTKRAIKLTIEEVRSPGIDAAIVGELIREDVEKRIRFRRILKQALDKIVAHKEVKGAKIMLSGRLDGAEMSRTQWAMAGRVPLQTLRANVDYALTEAKTTYGTIGIKVWIYKGDVFEKEKVENRK